MKKILIVVSRYNETNALLLNTIKNLKKNKIKLSVLKVNDNVLFEELFNVQEGRLGVIVTFLAVLELVKESLIDIIQNESMSNIYIALKS